MLAHVHSHYLETAFTQPKLAYCPLSLQVRQLGLGSEFTVLMSANTLPDHALSLANLSNVVNISSVGTSPVIGRLGWIGAVPGQIKQNKNIKRATREGKYNTVLG